MQNPTEPERSAVIPTRETQFPIANDDEGTRTTDFNVRPSDFSYGFGSERVCTRYKRHPISPPTLPSRERTDRTARDFSVPNGVISRKLLPQFPASVGGEPQSPSLEQPRHVVLSLHHLPYSPNETSLSAFARDARGGSCPTPERLLFEKPAAGAQCARGQPGRLNRRNAPSGRSDIDNSLGSRASDGARSLLLRRETIFRRGAKRLPGP